MDHAPGDWFQDSYALTSLALAPSTRSKLQRAGVHSARDLLRISGNSPSTLARECALTLDEASEVMKVVRFGVDGAALAGAKSASEMLREEAEKLPIYTFCQELDDLLGGGVAVGEITELCGCPGIGKTQMCDAAVRVRRRSPRGLRGTGTAPPCTWTPRGRSRRSARRTSPRRLAEAPGRCAKRSRGRGPRGPADGGRRMATCAPERDAATAFTSSDATR